MKNPKRIQKHYTWKGVVKIVTANKSYFYKVFSYIDEATVSQSFRNRESEEDFEKRKACTQSMINHKALVDRIFSYQCKEPNTIEFSYKLTED